MLARPRPNYNNNNNNNPPNNNNFSINTQFDQLPSNIDNQGRPRNKSGNPINSNNNVYLPPIQDNPQQNQQINNNPQRNLQSRGDQQQQSENNNYDNTPQYSNNFLAAEIGSLKKMVKKLLETQSDTQTRMNDYNKYFAEQESTIRVNNVKINEHDSKITEILMTFNNYLSLNDQSAKAINELSSNYDNVARKQDFFDIKNKFHNFDKIVESRLGEINGKFEDLSVKYQEIAKEQEVFQKYTLEKLKNYQLDNADNKIFQQQAIIKLEESKENRANFQIDTLRNLVRTCEKNIKAEETLRKSALENLRAE